jgi:hypothetical protein
MRGAILIAAALAAPTFPAFAQEPPPALIEATEEASALCATLGGTPSILDGYMRSLDLNGDGVPDFLTDLARLECEGARAVFCGPSGCPVAAWLSEPDGSHSRFDLGRMQGFALGDGDPPPLVARYPAISCGPDAAADCTRTWRFTTNAPDQPPVDVAPEPEPEAAPEAEAAAAKPIAVPSGWTLRRVPGASPMALGGGVGNIASLAAFCLSGQPFLAVTFNEPPPADSVSLDFAFSQGEVTATAGFEATAGGTFVVPLADGPLADRLAGRDSRVSVSVDGAEQGILSLSGSTRAIRAALDECR